MYLINNKYEVFPIKRKVNWYEFDEYNDFKKFLKNKKKIIPSN